MNDHPLRRPRVRGTIPVRHGRLSRSAPLVGIAKIAVAVLAVLAVSAGSITAYAAWDVVSSVKPGVHLATLPGHTAQPIPNVAAIKGGVNLLLVGTDTRTGQGGAFSSADELNGSSGAGNNDVTILLHIAQNHQSASVISFPRDMEVPIPACPQSGGGSSSPQDQAMINTTLSVGGLSCTVLTVEQLTGVTIPFAAEISFDGVAAMSNAVGGVTVCLATPVTDPYTNPQLNLPAGQQTLVGAMALSFLRSRHGVGDGSDLGRISSQQVFLSALVRKIASAGVLGNPVTLYALAKAATQNMVLSDTLTSPTSMVSIALALKNIGLGNIVFLQYPTDADPADTNRVIPDASSSAIVNTALQADQPLQLTGIPGRAAQLSPSATPAPASTTPTSTATSSPSAPAASATPAPTSTAVALPSNVTGQTAAEQTCTVGNNG
ncbi:LCP family protein [Rathayibacter soli]|uniref:LCP family protein n=1 Tax=Rathayibacter soli TaxID=3144168 RepID=UPI0027E59C3E|nr:LCP family protein [Glaciibacter superstes]